MDICRNHLCALSVLDKTRTKRADDSAKRLDALSVYETEPINKISYFKTRSFVTPDELPLSEFLPCEEGFTWERNRETAPDDRRDADVDVVSGDALPDELAVGENVWFHLQFTIPESMAGMPVYLNFVAAPKEHQEGDMGPPRLECLCYKDGEPWQAFDDGHEDLLLTDCANGGESFDLLIEAGTTTLWGLLDVEEFFLKTAQLYAVRESVADLARNYGLLNDLRKEIDDDSPNRKKITRALVEASHTFAFDADSEDEFAESASESLAILDNCKENLKSELTGYDITAIGHAHIDLAWLWPWSETVRKSARSFSNVLKLMEEYPEITFLQSQPHLYEFVHNRYPSVSAEIEERIEDDSWHPTGALWVESDINIAGGEALARQYLLGKRYFREKFDVDPKITFIPDVFGYSGSLPDIARAADCPYFFTQKLSWNNINEIPHSSFKWEGIGGSTVLSHFPPADTYNGQMTVEQVRESVINHDENDIVDESAYLYGWGDGGGGPTREMIENKKVINDTNSLPDISFGTLQGFFEDLSESADELPTWVGELYLEMHRGTLTTQAQTKRNNRKGEFALREAEIWSSLALTATDDFEYAHDRLEHAWKILLFNQFHDILPGSSVTDVYADADRDYTQVFETTDTVKNEALSALTDSTGPSNRICITNSLSWACSPVVKVDTDQLAGVEDENTIAVDDDGTEYPIQRVPTDDAILCKTTDVPALGATTLELVRREDSATIESPLDVSQSHIENAHLRVNLNDDGTISAYDKDAGRQLFEGDGNRLVSYRDYPESWDAWDIDQDVTAAGEQLPAPSDVEVIETGPIRATVRQTHFFSDSELVQEFSLELGGDQIDVRTEVDWNEDERLLKAHFPMAVHASEATFDIQFGHLKRDTHENTSWEEAQFEVPHQQWVDVSEHDYGVALLNDCKYGVNVDGTDVSLSLLRAPDSPDPKADRGHHEFKYAIYPHEGTPQEGGVIEAGYEFNAPINTVPVAEPLEYAPLDIAGDGVVVESIKRAEDGTGALIIRLYEAWGRQSEVVLNPSFSVTAAARTNLIEDHKEDLEISTDGAISLSLNAFDIETVRLEIE